MGMSLTANRGEPRGFEISYPRWGWLRHLLLSLDCDTREMKFINDGHEIAEQTLVAWADAITTALRRCELVYVPRDASARAHVPPFLDGLAQLLGVPVPQIALVVRRTAPGGEALSEKDAEFLESFSRWARNAGGCSQW